MRKADQPTISPALCIVAAIHRFGYKVADALSGFSEMAVGHMCIARRGSVPAMPKQPADQGQVFARHNGLTGGGMP